MNNRINEDEVISDLFKSFKKVPLSLAACKSNNRSGSRTYRTE